MDENKILNPRIAKKLETSAKRKSLTCKVYECKVKFNNLNLIQKEWFKLIFLEAKWYENYILSHENIDDADTKVESVIVKVVKPSTEIEQPEQVQVAQSKKSKNKKKIKKKKEYIDEERKLTVLSSQMKQGIKQNVFYNLMSLSALKKKGYKVGALKYKSVVNCINLKQFGVTYQLDFKKGRVKIQGLKKWMKVSGFKQFKNIEDIEYANAKLCRNATGYYLKITTYQPKVKNDVPLAFVAYDAGCITQLTTQEGLKIECKIPVSDKIRELDRKIMRHQKPKTQYDSPLGESYCERKKQHKIRKQQQKLEKKNRKELKLEKVRGKPRQKSKRLYHDKIQRQKGYIHQTNQKKDFRNKIINANNCCFKYTIIQNESIAGWQASGKGKSVTQSAIGGIMRDLENKSHTPIVVDRFYPSTKECPECFAKTKINLEDRIFVCSNCGYTKQRDWKSAICIGQKGLAQAELTDVHFIDQEKSNKLFFEKLSKIHFVKVYKEIEQPQNTYGL